MGFWSYPSILFQHPPIKPLTRSLFLYFSHLPLPFPLCLCFFFFKLRKQGHASLFQRGDLFEWAEIEVLCPTLLDLLGKIDSPIHSAPIRENMPHYQLLRAVICSVQCVGSFSSKKVESKPVKVYGFDIWLFRQTKWFSRTRHINSLLNSLL